MTEVRSSRTWAKHLSSALDEVATFKQALTTIEPQLRQLALPAVSEVTLIKTNGEETDGAAILADNFALIATGKSDVPSPEVLERLKALMKPAATR